MKIYNFKDTRAAARNTAKRINSTLPCNFHASVKDNAQDPTVAWRWSVDVKCTAPKLSLKKIKGLQA